MAVHPKRIGALFVLGLLLSTGCGALNDTAHGEESVPLVLLYEGSHCQPGRTAGATWISRPQELPPTMRRSEADSRWDGDKEGVLWISMGTRTSGGYGLELANPRASVREGVATLQVNWRRPAQGRFSTQALTSPCLLVKVPKAGIKSIRVVDQEGALRADVELH